MPGLFETEAALHFAFKQYRAQGEWFRNNGHLKKCIMALCMAKGKGLEIKTVKDLLSAGFELRTRQAANRKGGELKHLVNVMTGRNSKNITP